MEIKQVVIHELLKESGTQEADKHLAKKLLNTQSSLVEKLVIALDKLYGTKGNNAIYGTFSRQDTTNEFPDYTDQYIAEESDDHFLDLSWRCLAELVREARAQQSSTGGYIVFARYKSNQDFLLIAMIKKKDGLNVNENLEPEGVIEIDLSKIHQAARINLSTYINISTLSQDEQLEIEDKSYLSFVSPTTNKEVSGYFIKALDCMDGVRSGKATATAFSVVDNYCKSNSELKEFRAKAKDSLIQYFEECLKKNPDSEPATLAGVEHSFRQVVPGEKAHLIGDFSQFANSEDNKLPDKFDVNKAEVQKRTRIRAKTDNWQLSFERKALGTNDNSPLYFDGEDKLIIKCSEDLKKQITAQLSNGDEND